MKMKVYKQPAMRVVELQHGRNILQFSARGRYSSGGDGYSDYDVSDRSGYDEGNDGWGDSNVGHRSGYDWGGSGWD